MKNLLKICFLMSFIFCQVPSKAEYFLLDLKRLDKLDEKTSSEIKKELKKIENQVSEKFIISYKTIEIKEAVTERVMQKAPGKYAGTHSGSWEGTLLNQYNSGSARFNVTSSGSATLTLSGRFNATHRGRIVGNKFITNNNQTCPIVNQGDGRFKIVLIWTAVNVDVYLKQQLNYSTRVVSPREEIINNKTLPMDINTFSTRPKWEDVVEFYGGYAELGSKNINKTDWENGKFDLSGKLTDIELISETEAMAEVYLSGYLKLNKIPKSNYKYKGTYTVGYSNIYEIYKNEFPEIIFTFNNKKYMPNVSTLTEPLYPDTKIGGTTITAKTLDGHRSAIDMVFDDFISDDEFNLLLLNEELLLLNDAKGLSIDGKKNGWWSYKNNFGEKTFILWENDIYVERWNYEYYPNGQVKEEPSFKNAKKHGDWVRYFQDGTVSGKSAYKDGMKDGLWIEYFRPGRIAYQGKYKKNIKVGKWKWFWLNRDLRSKVTYDNGTITFEKCYDRSDGSSRDCSGVFSPDDIYFKND